MRTKSLKSLIKRKKFQPSVIFDVGANVGQSTSDFRTVFPEAVVYAFEPIKASFDKLSDAWRNDPKVRLYQMGLSNRPATMEMLSQGIKRGNRIPLSKIDAGEGPMERVSFTTGDLICSENKISKIDYLKIDTEGHDLFVVAGFAGMMIAGQVKYVQVEVGFAPENYSHVPYERIASVMFAFGFRLYGIFSLSRSMRRYHMRSEGAYFGDAVFVHDGVIS